MQYTVMTSYTYDKPEYAPAVYRCSKVSCAEIAKQFYSKFPPKKRRPVSYLFIDDVDVYNPRKSHSRNHGLTFLRLLSRITGAALDAKRQTQHNRRKAPRVDTIVENYTELVYDGLMVDNNGVPASFYTSNYIKQGETAFSSESLQRIARAIADDLINKEMSSTSIFDVRDNSFKVCHSNMGGVCFDR